MHHLHVLFYLHTLVQTLVENRITRVMIKRQLLQYTLTTLHKHYDSYDPRGKVNVTVSDIHVIYSETVRKKNNKILYDDARFWPTTY